MMKIISVRAPWWCFLVHSNKDIENRDWPTSYRGPVLLHASSWWKQEVVELDTESALRMREATGPAPKRLKMTWDEMRALGGHIVGRADIVDCVTASTSPWFVGRYGFVIANAKPVVPIPFKARLGLFDAPADVIAQLKEAA